MKLVRSVARPLIALPFVRGGWHTFAKPESRAELAGPTIERLRAALPFLPDDRVLLVRANAAVQVAAGLALATGKAPRLAATVLAASLVPTTIGGHAFWAIDDPARRSMQLTQFGKNLAMLGGLLLAAADDED